MMSETPLSSQLLSDQTLSQFMQITKFVNKIVKSKSLILVIEELAIKIQTFLWVFRSLQLMEVVEMLSCRMSRLSNVRQNNINRKFASRMNHLEMEDQRKS